MSYEDLKQHNIFLPEAMWGKTELKSSIPRSVTLAVGALGVASCALMWAGGGRVLTWLGALLFLGFIGTFAFMSHFAIERQNEKVDQRLEEAGEDPEEFEAKKGGEESSAS